MTLDHLQHFNGAPIHIRVDGLPALGILFFLTVDRVQVTSLCFLQAAGPCPLVTHDLTSAEIAGITAVSRNELKSAIALHSAPGALKPQERSRGTDTELAVLHERMQVSRRKARRKIALPLDLRQDARRGILARGEVRQSTKARKEIAPKSLRTRPAKKR